MNEVTYNQLRNAVENFGDAVVELFEIVVRAATKLVDLFHDALRRKEKVNDTRKGWICKTNIKIKHYIFTRKPFTRARSNL